MAFKDVNDSFDTKKKATELEVGEEFLAGYLMKISVRENEEGKEMLSFLFKQGDKVLLFYPAGNIKYLVAEGKIKEGFNTKIIRVDDKMVGKGKFKKNSSQFKVQQDPDDVLEGYGPRSVTPGLTSKPATNFAEKRLAD
jgi:hypothetical protein